MALNIKDPETDRLARELMQETGESLTGAVKVALRERLRRIKGRPKGKSLADELDEIALRIAEMPVIDARTPDEILGYDQDGLPT